MKNIYDLIEMSGKSYIKKFIIAAVLIFLYTFLTTWASCNHRGMFIIYEIDGFISIEPIVCISILIFFYMHYRRFKMVLTDGSFNRIRLLPVKKMSIVYSELLYVGCMYALLFVMIFLGWLLGVIVSFGWNINTIYYMITTSPFLYEYIPLSFIAAIRLILLYSMITFATVALLLSKADTDFLVGTVLIFILSWIIFKIINAFVSNMTRAFYTFPHDQMLIIYIIELLLLIVLTYVRLYKFYGRKGR